MQNYNVIIIQEGKYFVVKNIELGVVSQGNTVDEALLNIKEASELFLEDNKILKNNKVKQSFLTTISV